MACAPATAFPALLTMWAGMYAVLFTIAGAMFACIDNPD